MAMFQKAHERFDLTGYRRGWRSIRQEQGVILSGDTPLSLMGKFSTELSPGDIKDLAGLFSSMQHSHNFGRLSHTNRPAYVQQLYQSRHPKSSPPKRLFFYQYLRPR